MDGTFLRVMETALPLFVTLAIGVLCRTRKLLTPGGVQALKNVAVNITLPVVLCSAYATAEYTPSSILSPLVIFAVCVLAMLLSMGLCKALRVRGRLSPYIATGFEAGMLGYALFALLFPHEKTSSFAMLDLGHGVFVFTVYKIMLSGRGGLKSALRDVARSPVIWGILTGLVLGASGLYGAMASAGVNGIFDNVTRFIAAPTSALILLTIGYDFVPSEIRWRDTATLVALRIGVMGLMLCATLLFDRYVLGGTMHTGALVLLFCLPPPFVLPVFANVPEERANISSAMSALTLVTVLLFAALTVVFA